MKTPLLITATLSLIAACAGAQTTGTGDYRPMPLPAYARPVDTANHTLHLLRYSMATGQFDSIENPALLQKRNVSLLRSASGQNPANEFSKGGARPYSFSYLQPADQLSGFPAYPISAVVKLRLTFYRHSTGVYTNIECSGALINPSFVITAGHCSCDPQEGSYVTACTVIPAYNLGNAPFGQVSATHWWTFDQWANNGNFDYDMAIFRLAAPIGNSTGTLGWGSNMDNSFFTNPANIFHSFGYPAQNDFGNPVFEGGNRMYYMNGYMDFWQSQNTVCHSNIGFHGQSGSALYYRDPSANRYVFGVLSHGNGKTAPYYTCHCRMDGSMAAFFASVIPPVSPNGVAGEQQAPLSIQVYPNPSSGIVYLKASQPLPPGAVVQLKSLMGATIQTVSVQAADQPLVLDIGNQPDGLYLIQVKTPDRQYLGKVVKQTP